MYSQLKLNDAPCLLFWNYDKFIHMYTEAIDLELMIEFELMVHFHFIGFKMLLIDLYNLNLILLLTVFTNENKLFSEQSDFN